MKTLKILCTLLFLIGQIAIGNSQSTSSIDTDKLSSYLEVLRSKKKFSGEVLIAKGDSILFQNAIGMASYEHNLPLKVGAKFRIASITKTFTGMLIAMAQSEGKLKFEDNATKYIEGLSPKFDAVTIKHLLTHSSGLPHNKGIKDYWQTKSRLQMSTAQVISEINTLKLAAKPGTEFHYSSLGYYLLATILESIYEKRYEDILHEKILNPINMKNSGIVNTLDVLSNHASGYHLVTDDSLVVAPYRNYSMLKGAGDMYTNSCRFVALLK
ncbi:MAG: serine hydrolase domain-containing protein [Pricia sp.]